MPLAQIFEGDMEAAVNIYLKDVETVANVAQEDAHVDVGLPPSLGSRRPPPFPPGAYTGTALDISSLLEREVMVAVD